VLYKKRSDEEKKAVRKNLCEGGGDGNEEGSSSPKKSTESYDMSTVVTRGEVRRQRVTERLNK